MTTQLEPVGLTVADASAALTAAEDQHADVEGRIRAGDPTTTPDDLAAADSAVRFAHLRLDLARQQEAERTEAERQEEIAALQRRLVDLAARQDISKARSALERAMDAFAAACAAHDHELGECYMEASRLDVPRVRIVPGSGGVTTPQGTYTRTRMQDAIVAIGRDAIRKHYGPREQITLTNSVTRR